MFSISKGITKCLKLVFINTVYSSLRPKQTIDLCKTQKKNILKRTRNTRSDMQTHKTRSDMLHIECLIYCYYTIDTCTVTAILHRPPIHGADNYSQCRKFIQVHQKFTGASNEQQKVVQYQTLVRNGFMCSSLK